MTAFLSGGEGLYHQQYTKTKELAEGLFKISLKAQQVPRYIFRNYWSGLIGERQGLCIGHA
jgi:hypothetical protein